MAGENLKSTVITNADSTTYTLNKKGLSNGVVKVARATVEVATSMDNTSTYRMVRLPSRARIVLIKVYADDLGTNSAMDLGLYRTAADGGAVVDADAFGSAVVFGSAITTGTELQHESAVYGVEDIEKQLWQVAGASTDPQVDYDVTFTVTTTTDGAGTLSLLVLYTDGD